MGYVTDHPPTLGNIKAVIGSGAELDKRCAGNGSAWVDVGAATVSGQHFSPKGQGILGASGNVDSRNCGEVLVLDFIAFSRSGTGINKHSGKVGRKTDLSVNGAYRLDVIWRDGGHVPMAKMSRSQSGH